MLAALGLFQLILKIGLLYQHLGKEIHLENRHEIDRKFVRGIIIKNKENRLLRCFL